MLNPARRDWIILLFILVLAAGLRLDAVFYNHYRGDEADLSNLAYQMASTGVPPATGIPSSAGIPNSPLTAYFLVPPYWIASSPLAVMIYIALWNVIGVLALWLLARDMFGSATAHAAGLLYAVAPWAIWLSTRVWSQDYHAPIIVLGVWLAWKGYHKGRWWAQILAWPLVTIGMQMHYAGWALAPLLLVFLGIGVARRKLRILPLVCGLALAALTMVPFYTGVVGGGDGNNTRLLGFFGKLTDALRSPSPEAARVNLQLATGQGLPEFLDGLHQNAFNAHIPPMPGVALLLGLLLLVGLIAVWRRGSMRAIVLWAWIAVPILIFTPPWLNVAIHYFGPVLPALCLAQGVGVDWLRRLGGNVSSKAWRVALMAALAAALAIIPATQMLSWRQLMNYVDHNQLDNTGLPLHYMLSIRETLAPRRDVIIDSEDRGGIFGFNVWQMVLLKTGCVRPATFNNSAIVLPQHPFGVLHVPDLPRHPAVSLFTTGTPLTPALRPGDTPITLYFYDRAPALAGVSITDMPDAAFDNGLILNGYAVQDGSVYLRWNVPQPPDADYQVFVHALDSGGKRIAQRDFSFFPVRWLCTADQIITWTPLPLDANAVMLHVGMYKFEGQGYKNSNLVGGDAGRQWREIPLRSPQQGS